MTKYPIRLHKSRDSYAILGDGKIALGIIIGFLCPIILFLFLTPNNFNDYVPLIVSMLVALSSTFLAVNALLEQRKSREAGTDPVILVHLGQREDAKELITFNISNVGEGAALNVMLRVEKPKGGIKNYNIVSNIFRAYIPFAVLLQGKSIELNFALGFDLIGKNPLEPFKATVNYKNLSGDEFESSFNLDVREMGPLTAHKSPLMRSVGALEKIAYTLKR